MCRRSAGWGRGGLDRWNTTWELGGKSGSNSQRPAEQRWCFWCPSWADSCVIPVLRLCHITDIKQDHIAIGAVIMMTLRPVVLLFPRVLCECPWVPSHCFLMKHSPFLLPPGPLRITHCSYNLCMLRGGTPLPSSALTLPLTIPHSIVSQCYNFWK